MDPLPDVVPVVSIEPVPEVPIESMPVVEVFRWLRPDRLVVLVVSIVPDVLFPIEVPDVPIDSLPVVPFVELPAVVPVVELPAPGLSCEPPGPS
jgi:hypothetical protein